MKTPKSSKTVSQMKSGTSNTRTPSVPDSVMNKSGVMTRSQIKRLAQTSIKISPEFAPVPKVSVKARKALYDSPRDSQAKLLVTSKLKTPSRSSKKKDVSASSYENDSIIESPITKKDKSNNNINRTSSRKSRSISVVSSNELENEIVGSQSNIKEVSVLLRDVCLKGKKKIDEKNSKVNSPFKNSEFLNTSVKTSNNSNERSPDCTDEEVLVKQLSKKNETVALSKEHDLSKSSRKSDKSKKTGSSISPTEKIEGFKLPDDTSIKMELEYTSDSESPVEDKMYRHNKTMNKTDKGKRKESPISSTLENSMKTDCFKTPDDTPKRTQLNASTSEHLSENVMCNIEKSSTKAEKSKKKGNSTLNTSEISVQCDNDHSDTSVKPKLRCSDDSESEEEANKKINIAKNDLESRTVNKEEPKYVTHVKEKAIKEDKFSDETDMFQFTSTDKLVVKSEIKEEKKSPGRLSSSSKSRQESPGTGTKQHKVGTSPVFKNQQRKELKSESSDSDSDAESRKAIMESAQKRIIQNLSTSESESRKFVKPLSKLDKQKETSDSDSAPEAMSFGAGRQLVMDSLKNAVESIQKEKQRRKEKRKQRLEKYKQQKEEKLIRLKEKRASQEDASCSSSEESGYEEEDVPSAFAKGNKKQGVKREKENLDEVSHSKAKKFHSDDETVPKEKKEKKRKHEEWNVPQHFGNLKKLPDDVLENLPDQIPMKYQKVEEATSKEKRKHETTREKRQATDFRSRSDIDYIPLSTCGATEFGVMPLDTLMRAPKSMAQQAAEFRQKMLFGSRIKRGPANAQAIYQQKLKASGKDRMVR